MTSPQMIQQAKAGDAEAIVQLLNANLNPKGIQVRVKSLGNGSLAVALLGQAVASQESVENYLKSAFKKLAAPSLHTLELSYRQNQQPNPVLWRSQIELVPASRSSQSLAPPELKPANAEPTAMSDITTEARQPQKPLSSVPAQSSKPKRYADPFSIWLQWQTTSLSAFLLIGILGACVGSLLLVPLTANGGSVRLNGLTSFLFLGTIALIVLPLAGLILGDSQTRFLRKWLHRIGGWRWMTPLGVLFGFAVAVGSHFLGWTFLSAILLAAAERPASELWQGGLLVAFLSAVSFALGFLTLGFFQWLMLQGSVSKAHQWIWSNGIASVLSWFLGLGFGMVLAQQLFNGTLEWTEGFTWVIVLFLGSIISWFLFSAFTGITMARLLSKVPLRDL